MRFGVQSGVHATQRVVPHFANRAKERAIGTMRATRSLASNAPTPQRIFFKRSRVPLIRTRQPPDREFDPIAGQDSPALDLGLVGRLRESTEHFAGLLPCRFAWQGKSLPAIRTSFSPAGQKSGRLAGDITRAPGRTHDDTRNLTRRPPGL